MSTVFNEGAHTAEFLLSEGNGQISREQVTIADTAPAMAAGTVVGKITSSGKYVPYNNFAYDGSEVAAGILYHAVADKATDQTATIIARNAEVMGSALIGLDTPGRAALAALGIIVR